MRERTALTSLAAASGYIDEAIDEARTGVTSQLRAASRIVGLGELDAVDQWARESRELRELLALTGAAEVNAEAAEFFWPSLLEAAASLRSASSRL